MANPALKNGFLSVANELVEHFAKINLPGNEMRLIWVVWRKTWGWQDGDRKKDWDLISLSQFEKETEMKHSNVAKGLKSLVVKRLLLKSEKGYRFNQNYDQWVVAKRLRGVAKSIQSSSQKTTKSSSQKTTHNIKKETNKRNTVAQDATKPPRSRKEKYADPTPFSLSEYVASMRASPQKHIRIIAEYADTKKPNKDTKGQWYEFTERNLVAARNLSPYTDQQIASAFEKLEKDLLTPQNPKGFITKWTLETLTKYLDDI